jgi:hypothetical protein
MRTLFATLAVAAACALGACGGSSSSGPPRATTVVAAAPASTPQPAGPASSTVTPSAASPSTAATAPRRKDPHKAKMATAAQAPTPTTRHAPASRGPAAERKAEAPAPLGCLRLARLKQPRLRSPGLWGANDPGSGRPVLVDGPYETTSSAATSAASLDGVSFARAAGRFVVSASLRSRLEDKVSAVARCLGARG